LERNTENELGRLILRLANTIIKNRNHHLEALNLTTEQADSLQFFLAHEEATVTELKDHLGITHQTAWGIVQRMAEKGLITLRISDADARCRLIAPTEAGAELGTRMMYNRERTGRKLFHGMTDEEQAVFIGLLEKALKNVEND
jgi:DNA-binding MarR family transcriptional regulator